MPEVEVQVGRDGDGREWTGEELEEELRSLLRWLREDESLKRQVNGSLTGTAPRVKEHMGTLFDLLQLVIETGLSSGSLAVSLLQWRGSRRRRPPLTLRRGPVEVEISDATAADAETIARIVALLEQENGGDGSAS